MISALSSSLSALAALGKKMGVTANNVANSNTNGFKKSSAVLEEGAGGGVKVKISKPQPAEPRSAYTEHQELSNVDLGSELVNTMTIKTAYEANLESLKTQEEISGSVIDLIE